MTKLTKAAREALEALEAGDSALNYYANNLTSDYPTGVSPYAAPIVKAEELIPATIATLRAALSEAPGEERDGWVLVPVEPTQAMMDAMQSGAWMPGNYRAMLAARPDPERAAARQRIVGPSLPELVDRLRDAVPEVSGQVAARHEALTEEQIAGLYVDLNTACHDAPTPSEMFAIIVRAVERAHGIGKEGGA